MKQTQNAIKFLMAQYRAIFKHAYLKGLVSAAVLTAGFATTANATGALDDISELPAQDQEVTIDGSGASSDTFTHISLNSNKVGTLNGTITIIAGPAHTDNNRNQILSGVNLSGNGSIIVDIGTVTKNYEGLAIGGGGATSTNGTIVNIGEVKVNSGLLYVIDNKAPLDGYAATKNVTLAAKTITIGGAGDNARIELEALGSGTTSSTSTLGRITDTSNSIDGSDITVDSNGLLSVKSSGYGTAIVVGDSLTAQNGGILLTQAANGGNDHVYIKSDLTQVGESGYWVVSGATTVTSNETNIEGGLLVSGGALTIEAAPDTFEGTTTTKNAGTFTLKANSQTDLHNGINVTGGELVVESGAKLYVAENTGIITVTDDGKSYWSQPDNSSKRTPTLRISSSDLQKYLAGNQDYNPIEFDGSKITSGSGTSSLSGSLFLASGGRLVLSDSDVDLTTTFSFNSGSAPSSTDGKITVDSTWLGIISGSNLKISDTLRSNYKSGTTAINSNPINLFVESDNLTLGSDTYKNGPIGLAINSAKATNNLTLKQNGGEFTVKNNIILDRDYYTQTRVDESKNYETLNNSQLTKNSSGYITGDNININFHNTSLNNFIVNGGSWETSSNIKVTSGSLLVGYDATAGSISSNLQLNNPALTNNKNNGNPAYFKLVDSTLTLNGGSKANSIVKVAGSQGANATLDLLKADVAWNNGSITLSGNAIAASSITMGNNNCGDTIDPEEAFATETVNGQLGWGKLLLKGETFDTLLTSGNANNVDVNIGNYGYVYVDSTLTDKYNFDKFGSSTLVNFTNTGNLDEAVLEINGDISLFTETSGSLSLGVGTIKAHTVELNSEQGAQTKLPENVVLAAGGIEVSQGIESINKTITIGDAGGSNNARLTLNTDESLDVGTINNNLDLTATNSKEASLQVKNGQWSMAKNDILSDGGYIIIGEAGSANELLQGDSYTPVSSLVADNLQIKAASVDTAHTDELIVNAGSTATFNTMQTKVASDIQVDGKLTIEGKAGITDKDDPALVNKDSTTGESKTAGIDFTKGTTFTVDGLGAQLVFGETATNALVGYEANLTDADADTAKKTNFKLSDELLSGTGAKFDVKNFGELKLSLTDSYEAIDKYDAKYFVDSLLGTSTTGYLNLGDAKLDIVQVQREDNKVEYLWEEVEPFAQITAGKATNDKLKSALISGIDRKTANVQGHYGALQVNVDASTTALKLAGPTSLHNAADFGGYFVFAGDDNSTAQAAVDVQLLTNASLALYNGGKIGAITGDITSTDLFIDNENGVKTEILGAVSKIDGMYIDGETEVSEGVTANYINVSSSLTSVGADPNNFVHVNDGEIETSGIVTTNFFKVGKANGSTTIDGQVDILGQVKTGKLELDESDITVTGLVSVAGDATMTKVTGANSSSDIDVGYHPVNTVADDKDTSLVENQSYSGLFEVKGATTLNGGYFSMSPDYSVTTAYASLNNLASAPASSNTDLDAGTLDGSAFVGGNSVLGIGSADLASLQSEVYQYASGKVLDENSLGAILYVGKKFVIGKDQGLTLTAQLAEDFVESFNKGNASDATGVLADFAECADPVKANTFYFGANTAIVVEADAMSKVVADSTVTNQHGLIHFEGTVSGDTTNKGLVIADGGNILVDGDLRANTYQVFSNADIKYLDGEAYDKVGSDSAYYDKNINVSTENNFLVGVVDKNGQVELGVNKNGRAIMTGASDPVYTTLIAYVNGYNGSAQVAQDTPTTGDEGTAETASTRATDDTNNEAQTSNNLHPGVAEANWLYTYNQDGTKNYTAYSNSFLQQTISTGNGAAAEQVARLGIYGGSVQAAISAGATTSDAVSARMGMGAQTGSVTFADNGQGAGLWVAPIYKSHDSDGFGAQGVNYGADMDLYGVALGGDFTMANGFRAGAAFNVGSGDADGQGAGAGVSNDFDYYGFTVYGGYTMDNLSVVGDISYTVVDNDVTANTAFGKVSSTMDTTNLSVGVTGQYTLSMDAVDVTPHAGLRYTYIDMDDYTVKGDADVAHYAGDSMSIFSIPVGVTFSKDIVAGGWTVKPAFDLTLTANVGDDEIDGSVTWAGVENLKTNLTTEVIDTFTYGATLGVSAKTGNFSLGVGVNYTGASDADEFGVNANARFMF